MPSEESFPIGSQVRIEGHFATPVILEQARKIGNSYELRVRLPDGTLDETILTEQEAAKLQTSRDTSAERQPTSDANQLRLLVESARIRLAAAISQFVELRPLKAFPERGQLGISAKIPNPASAGQQLLQGGDLGPDLVEF
jgi:hypothetical protein